MKSGSLNKYKGIAILAAAAALFWLARRFFPSLADLLLWGAIIAFALVLLLTTVVIVLAFSGARREQTDPERRTDRTLAEGRTRVLQLRRMGMRIKNSDVRSRSDAVCDAAARILQTLQDHPENIPALRQFFAHYLPTQESILEKYLRVQDTGTPPDDLTQKVLRYLEDIGTAMTRQYESLFAGDLLDLSVEMEAMTAACRRDGLLPEEELSGETAEGGITLSL